MSGPRILFVADAGPRVGGGHVMRSLTLAGALQAQGATCAFVATPAVAGLMDAFAPAVERAAAPSGEPRDLATAIAGQAFDAMVFDHYGLTERDHALLSQGRPALAVDDLADRPLGADVVLDSGPARTAKDYDGLVPEAARLLLGPGYAPVRPEFAALRETALAWRGEPVQRLLVSMGLTDLDGITARVVERLRMRVGEVGLDVVLGQASPSLAGLSKIARRDGRLALHVDTPHMARLTAEADIGIGAAGSSTWERCTLGLPSILVIVAENQRPAAEALAARGAALVTDAEAADFDAVFDRALMRLLNDRAARLDLSRRSAEVCDGTGAGRVAEAFLQLIARRAAQG
jgi:UDP-2,4-diacetamido-2,4,6-trideoxy-beta-L-altropyranose hydrolase